MAEVCGCSIPATNSFLCFCNHLQNQCNICPNEHFDCYTCMPDCNCSCSDAFNSVEKSLQPIALASIFSIWNLDFFRSLYLPFCLHPAMTTVQALALDYAIAVYPLVLITISYLLVELHDHDFKIIVWLWNPYHKCFTCLRREWNIKLSLIDALLLLFCFCHL